MLHNPPPEPGPIPGAVGIEALEELAELVRLEVAEDGDELHALDVLVGGAQAPRKTTRFKLKEHCTVIC